MFNFICETINAYVSTRFSSPGQRKKSSDDSTTLNKKSLTAKIEFYGELLILKTGIC